MDFLRAVRKWLQGLHWSVPGAMRTVANDFDAGDVYSPPRTRSHAVVPQRTALSPFHSHLRQWIFLRIRHVQHYRLDRPRPKAALGKELGLPEAAFDAFPNERCTLPAGPCRPRFRRPPLQGWKLRRRRTDIVSWRRRHMGSMAVAANGGSMLVGSRSRRRSPASSSIGPRSVTRVALASQCRREGKYCVHSARVRTLD